MNAAIVVAVEKYADLSISERKYAEADARRFAAVLEQHGFDPDNREILVNNEATKTSIESAVRTTLKRLTKDDSLYFYYAGHGFSKEGESHLSCHDTRLADLVDTSLGWAWLFQQFQRASCRPVVMFLDSCTSGLLANEELRGIYADLNEAELRASFESAEHCVCFAACQNDEHSHADSDLKHGIWTHHLSQAFDGRELTALHGSRLTSSSLQNHLLSVVPATLRKMNPQGVQTPSLFGAIRGDIQLADLAELLARRKVAKHPQAGQLKDSILLARSTDNVTSLSGFQKSKGHFIPDRHGSAAQSYIREIARDDLQQDAERVRASLKREFGFTRRQLSVNIQAGLATITTPKFNYSVSVEQDPSDAGKAAWRRAVDEITDPDQVFSDEFETVFAHLFDTVELSLHGAVDLDQLIDRIEALGSPEIRVDYNDDEGATSCVVRVAGHNVEIKVTPGTFSLVYPRAQTPRRLLASLFDIQHALMYTHNVLTIPFASARGAGRVEP